LLAGERLALDLKRLEMAYLDQNQREYEIVKHISLRLHNPLALIALKETGRCSVTLPEELFDRDYPGHYMRRIKNVTLTLPAVTGPYTNLNCTLTLRANQIRLNADLPSSRYPRTTNADGTPAADPRFSDDFAAQDSFVTSSGQNDSGMFDLNFRDERYLPFEGAGVISTWDIELPRDTNAFDLESVSDVILKLSYTARDGGAAFKQAARDYAIVPAALSGLRMFSARHEFATEWHQFLNPRPDSANLNLDLDLTRERFPHVRANQQIRIERVQVFVLKKDGTSEWGTERAHLLQVNERDNSGSEIVQAVLELDSATTLRRWNLTPLPPQAGGNLRLQIDLSAAASRSRLANLQDLIIVCNYVVDGGGS
jgi:hypothetical protein